MHFPYTISFFGEKIYWHFIFETLAFIIGLKVYYLLKKNYTDAISDIHRLYILLGATTGALFGSRIIAAFEMPQELHHLSLIKIYANKTIVGGLLGGLLGVEGTKKIIHVNTSSGDIYVIPIIVALIIGRTGCFSMGIAEPTFGIETTFFTGINLGDGKLRHPIMLYEIFFLLLLLIFFLQINKKQIMGLNNGDRFKIFMLLYFTFRFLVEFIKPYHALFLRLSIIQWCGIFMWLYYAPFVMRMIKRFIFMK